MVVVIYLDTDINYRCEDLTTAAYNELMGCMSVPVGVICFKFNGEDVVLNKQHVVRIVGTPS